MNAKRGFRGFSKPEMMRGEGTSAEAVGVWVADWQFVPCAYTHKMCVDLMKNKMGYKNSFGPKIVEGVDSFSLKSLSNARVDPKRFPCPWGDCNVDKIDQNSNNVRS